MLNKKFSQLVPFTFSLRVAPFVFGSQAPIAGRRRDREAWGRETSWRRGRRVAARARGKNRRRKGEEQN
jgi:hypothetical protein